jgi:hypothetical protein
MIMGGGRWAEDGEQRMEDGGWRIGEGEGKVESESESCPLAICK